MPRLQPPSGYMTGQEARERLNISDTLLRRHVTRGELRRYGPLGRTHKPWYKEEEVEALIYAQQMLEEAPVRGAWKNNPTTSFELATEEDMPAIIDIDERTFKHPAASLETCLSWFRKNPHTFYVLKNDQGVVRAYASLVPMSKVFIDRFVRDELDGEDITADMVDEYVSGKPLHIYVMAIATDPDCTVAEKHAYGGHIVLGLFRFLLELASRGIDIQTITSRNYMQEGKDGLKMKDGFNLLKKMGFTQLKSSVPGVNLFVINVPESGISILERYSRILEKWKAEHSSEERTA